MTVRLGPRFPGWGRLEPDPGYADSCVITPEPAREDEDEDDHNEGYL